MPDDQSKPFADPGGRQPGVCTPFEEKLKEWPPILGDKELVRKVWESTDALAYMYIWQLLVSF